MSSSVDQRAAGRPMVRVGRLLVLISALLVIKPDDGHGAVDCASVPKDERWLQPLCEAIQDIVVGKDPPPIEIDGKGAAKLWRNQNGTTIDIDFKDNIVGSSVIARLLSGSTFIPTERIDLVVIRNASLAGTLDLSHATIEAAVQFHNVRFNLNAAAPGRDALVLLGVEAKKRLAIRDSLFGGDVRIASSRLRGGLQLGRGPDEDDDGVDTRVPSLFVVKSSIEGEMLIGPVQVAREVSLDRSTMDAVTIVHSEFEGPVEIVDNRLGALSVWSSTFDGLSIANNAVTSSMQLRVVRMTGDAPPSIRDNDINGGLTVTMREVAASAADFSRNTVGRSTDIWLPQDWRGSLGLSHSIFRSRLALCQARYNKGTLEPVPARIDPGLGSSCRGPEQEAAADQALGLPSAVAAEVESAKVTTIDLRSAEADTLVWRIPLSCSFRWEGTGLRYRNWAETAPAETEEASGSAYECSEAPPSERNTPLIGSTDGLMLMRHLMKEDDVDALNTMADYLESRGRIVESRDIREEAKRANYLSIPEQAGFLDEWSRRAASWILRPVGYGAKPEHSLIWLFGVWLLSLLIYIVYSSTQRKGWKRSLEKQGKLGENLGYSLQPGFMQFDKEKDPKDFDIVRYSIDAMVPVINLHTYDRYYPQNSWLRFYSGAQHALGWFLITIFLVSAAVL